jgi:hypothetical protein
MALCRYLIGCELRYNIAGNFQKYATRTKENRMSKSTVTSECPARAVVLKLVVNPVEFLVSANKTLDVRHLQQAELDGKQVARIIGLFLL